MKDALKLPVMKNTKLIAGKKGIDRPIKWVTIVEILEDIDRVQDGEFLITTGFNLMKDNEVMEVFHNLFRLRPLSGVAIYTSFYMKKIPDSLIELADKHNLPLIEIPIDINFSEITKAILEQIVNRQTRLLEQSDKIHRELSTLILNDQSLTEVTKRLAQLTDSKIYIFNEFYQVRYSNIEFLQNATNSSQTTFTIDQETIDLSNYLLRSLEKESKEHITVKKVTFTIYPIIAKQFCFGWIVMVKRLEEWQELDDIAIERATSIYAMEFLKKQAVEETKLRIQSNLLEDIFSRNYVNEQLIIDQGLKLNYNFTLMQSVFHFTFKQNKKIDIHLVDRLYHMTEQILIQKNKPHIIQTKLHSIILLTNVNGETKEEQQYYALQLASEIRSEWDYFFPDNKLVIGIGKSYNNVKELGKSAQEAQDAVQLIDLISMKDSIAHYQEFGIYDLLLNMKRLGIKLSTIYSENINRLQAESGKEIDLIETIEIYFKNNQSIQQTAKELFIHRHTLRYRLDQVEQRTGLNLKSTDDLLKLQLGLMAYKLDKVLGQKFK